MVSSAPRHRFRILVAALGVALIAAGCSDAGSAASATMQSGNRPSATSELPPSTTDPESAPSQPPTSAPPDEPASDPEAFCESLEEFVRTNAAGDGVDALLGWFDEWRELGPSHLHDDLDVLTAMVEALDGLDGQDPSSIGRLLEAVLDPQVVESIDAIASYAADECGVDLDAGGLGNLDDVFGGGGGG